MTKRRVYSDEVDVLTAARDRMRHIYDIFDAVVVMFSGGKDSMSVLHIAHEIAQERSIQCVNVVFRDEELISQCVIDTVTRYRDLPWVRMLYFAVPLVSHKYVLGKTYSYTQWDSNRRWVRQPPDFAIRLVEGDKRSFDEFTTDDFIGKYFKGKIAFCTGIRADESLVRLRSCINKLNENYIVNSETKGINLCKPIFDWTEKDVFKYLHDVGAEYAPIYDAQTWADTRRRVSTPIHAEAAKRFHVLRAVDPILYAQVIDVFPEMLEHERYYRDLDRQKVYDGYESNEGIKTWIDENIDDPVEHKLAIMRYNMAMKMSKKYPNSYNPRHILKQFMSGGYKRQIQPDYVSAQRKSH